MTKRICYYCEQVFEVQERKTGIFVCDICKKQRSLKPRTCAICKEIYYLEKSPRGRVFYCSNCKTKKDSHFRTCKGCDELKEFTKDPWDRGYCYSCKKSWDYGEYIVCPLCFNECNDEIYSRQKHITPRHLKLHNYTIEQFKKEFPGLDKNTFWKYLGKRKLTAIPTDSDRNYRVIECFVEDCFWNGKTSYVRHLYKEAEGRFAVNKKHQDFIDYIIDLYTKQNWTKSMLIKEFKFIPDEIFRREGIPFKTRKETAQDVLKHGNNPMQNQEIIDKLTLENWQPLDEPKIRKCKRCGDDILVYQKCSSKSYCDKCAEEKYRERYEEGLRKGKESRHKELEIEINGEIFFKDQCPRCGKETLVESLHIHHKYCFECFEEFRAPKHPLLFLYNMYFRACFNCGQFINMQNRSKYATYLYCHKCYVESEEAKPISRGPNWGKQQQKALERDNCTCQNPGCGKTKSNLGCNPSVHHITPFRKFGYKPGENMSYIQANDLNNLICYCNTCHGKFENKPDICKQHLEQSQLLTGAT